MRHHHSHIIKPAGSSPDIECTRQLLSVKRCLTLIPGILIIHVIVFTFLLSAHASAALATAPLSQLVDQKAGVYLEATDLNSHLQKFMVSPLVTRFRQSHVFHSWLQSQDVKNLKQGLRDIESVTEQPTLPMLNNVFGEAVGLAIFNNGPKQPPSFLLLTRIKDTSAVRNLFEIWFNKTGLKITSSTFQNVAYSAVTQQGDSAGKSSPPVYYSFLDQTLIVTENEQVLHSTINLHLIRKDKKQPRQNQTSLFNLKTYQRAQSALSNHVAGSVFLNPRIWDDHIEPPKNEVEQTVVNWWKKMDAISTGLHLKNTLALETVILFNPEALNIPLLDLIQIPSEIPDAYSLIPKDALAVISGQINVHLLTRKIVDYYADKNPEKWAKIHAVSIGLLGGLDPVSNLSKVLGPNFLLYSVPRKELSFDAISFDGLVALQLSPPVQQTETTNKNQYQSALDNVSQYLLNSMITHYNSEPDHQDQPAIIKAEKHELFQMRWIEGFESYQPAYGISERQIAFASSPELLKDFFTLKSEESLAALPLFQTWRETFFQQENQLCFLNVSSIKAFIDQNFDFLAQQIAQGQGGDLKKGQNKLSGLKSILESFDGLFFAAGVQKSRIRIIVGLGSLEPTQ